MKIPKISDFRNKITLLKTVTTTDAELNRIESLVPIKRIWAVVEAKASNVDITGAGIRPEIEYNITVRKQEIETDYFVLNYIRFNGKTLRLTAPIYEVENKYIVMKAVEIASDDLS